MRSKDDLLADISLVTSAASRFHSKLRKIGGCIVFTGPKAYNGYGEFWLGENNVRAHRFAYVLKTGEVPRRRIVMHTCDNPPCCNPAHLRVGTHGDNARDRTIKGRSGGAGRGERHHNAKLTDRQAESIRRMKGVEQRLLAAVFGVSKDTIFGIQAGRIRANDRIGRPYGIHG